MTRDPNSYIQASAEALAETLASKNQDYAPTGEFSNFETAADVAGISVLQLITAQIAIKMTRIKTLRAATSVSNEPLKDSFLDLAGYATIGHAWLSYVEEPTSDTPAPIEDREIIRNSADDAEPECPGSPDGKHRWLLSMLACPCAFCPATRPGGRHG